MRRSALGTALIVVVSLTACGGGGSKKAAVKQSASTSSTTSGTAPTSTAPAGAATTAKPPSRSAPASTATTEGEAAVKAKARSLLLVQGDFPTGWAGSPTSTSAQDREDEKKFAACMGAADPAVAYVVDEDGLDFANGGSGVGSSASVSRTDDDYRKDAAAVQGPKLEPCLKQQITDVIQREGATVKQVGVDRFAVERHGTLSIGIHTTVAFSHEGQDATLYSDLFLYGKGRTELTLTFTSLDTKVDPALENKLASIAGRRLDAAA